jgi:hypothetical protein
MSTAFEIPEWLLTAPAPPAPPADDHRIEGMVNHFIAGKQEALFTAPDGFYRLRGADAIQGQPAINDRLQALRAATLGLARDDSERAALGPRLDLHIDDAADGIDRHIAEQRRVYQRQVVSQRQALIQRAAELEHDNDAKIMGLAEANATAAREGARMDGIAPNSPEEAVAILGARSDILRRAIDERIANGKGAQALALFDQVKDQLAPADRLSLDTPVQATRNDQLADQWIDHESKANGPPLQQRVESDPDVPSDVKPIVRAKVDVRESADESARTAKVQALDDELHEAARIQVFNPNAYRPGTFTRLAAAYAAAREPERAAFARRMAAQDAFIVPFAQASAEKQQRMIDELQPGELRDSAIAIRDGQAQSFDHDPFAAGTTIYREVGAPAPVDDIEGRIRQARQISQLRGGITVVPFTVREIDDMRRALANGSEQDKQAVRDRLAAIPADMRPQIKLQEEAGPAGSTHWVRFKLAPSMPQSIGAENGASAAPPAGGQSGSPATEPVPGSPEYQAADAQARELDKASYDDLSAWQRFEIEVNRFALEGERKGATFSAESAARHLQTAEELRQRSQTEELRVYEKKFLLKNRNAATNLASAVGQLVNAQRKLNALPSSDAVRQLFEAKSVAEAAKLLDEKGGKIASAIGLGSLPTLTMGLVATAALGPVGGGIALTGSAGLDGYANGLIGGLVQEGIDINDPSKLAAALQDKKLMEVVRRKAVTQSAIDAGVAALASMIGVRGRAKPQAAAKVGEQEAASITEREAAAGERRAASAIADENPEKPDLIKQLEANVLKGKEFERKIEETLIKKGVKYAKQVTIKSPNAPPTRIDFVVWYEGKIYLIEARSGSPYPRGNQKIAFPELAKSGGVIIGKGKEYFRGGMIIPPTRVQIQTPKGTFYVERPLGGKQLSLKQWKEQSDRLDGLDQIQP